MNLQIEELETELGSLKEKVLELKELIDNLIYLWDKGELHPDAEEVLLEIREVADGIEI